jgi:hypothetical protein
VFFGPPVPDGDPAHRVARRELSAVRADHERGGVS